MANEAQNTTVILKHYIKLALRQAGITDPEVFAEIESLDIEKAIRQIVREELEKLANEVMHAK